jgi:hypothetical protein
VPVGAPRNASLAVTARVPIACHAASRCDYPTPATIINTTTQVKITPEAISSREPGPGISFSMAGAASLRCALPMKTFHLRRGTVRRKALLRIVSRVPYAAISTGRPAGFAAQPRAAGIRKPLQLRTLVTYSITWSARVSNIGDSVRPSAFAVLTLMTKTKLVASSTGRSAGSRPFDNLVDKGCRLPIDGSDIR